MDAGESLSISCTLFSCQVVGGLPLAHQHQGNRGSLVRGPDDLAILGADDGLDDLALAGVPRLGADDHDSASLLEDFGAGLGVNPLPCSHRLHYEPCRCLAKTVDFGVSYLTS